MDVSEKWGTDVDTAVNLALAELKLTIDEVDVTVLEEPSRGFFGIGSKLALVRVEKKKPVEKVKAEEVKEKVKTKPEPVKAQKKEKIDKPEKKPEPEPKKSAAPAVVPAAETADLSAVKDHSALVFLKEVTDWISIFRLKQMTTTYLLTSRVKIPALLSVKEDRLWMRFSI